MKYAFLKASRTYEYFLKFIYIKIAMIIKNLIFILYFMLYMFRFIIFNYIFSYILIGNFLKNIYQIHEFDPTQPTGE